MYHRIDRVIIERYLNAEQLGYYATADNIAGLLSIVPVAFMTSIYPTLSVHADQGRVFSYISDLSTRWVTIFCVGLAGVISISSQLLINSIYGIEFLPSGSVLGILVWAQIAVSLGVVLAQIFISKNLQTYLLISTLLGSVINIIGNLVLIPIYGISGSAWATVISYSVAGIFGFLIYLPTRKVSTNAIRILFRVLLVCGIGIGISYAFRGHLIISIVAYSVVFCIGLLVSGLVTKMDISLVKGMLPIKIVVADQDSR
jgi:O-antigen/teichoic acid export membrane protein